MYGNEPAQIRSDIAKENPPGQGHIQDILKRMGECVRYSFDLNIRLSDLNKRLYGVSETEETPDKDLLGVLKGGHVCEIKAIMSALEKNIKKASDTLRSIEKL